MISSDSSPTAVHRHRFWPSPDRESSRLIVLLADPQPAGPGDGVEPVPPGALSADGPRSLRIRIDGLGETEVCAWSLRGAGPPQDGDRVTGGGVTREVFDAVKSALARSDQGREPNGSGADGASEVFWVAAVQLSGNENPDAGDEPGASVSHRFVGSATAFIRNNLTRRITTRDAAHHAGASTQHFCRVFSQATGQPFMRYVGELRAARAAELLATSALSIKEAAFQSGFGSIAQFNRLFKRCHGLNPKDYRRKHAEPRRHPAAGPAVPDGGCQGDQTAREPDDDSQG